MKEERRLWKEKGVLGVKAQSAERTEEYQKETAGSQPGDREQTRNACFRDNLSRRKRQSMCCSVSSVCSANFLYSRFDDELGRTRVFLRATADIKCGEEIFVPYDKTYWLDNLEEQVKLLRSRSDTRTPLFPLLLHSLLAKRYSCTYTYINISGSLQVGRASGLSLYLSVIPPPVALRLRTPVEHHRLFSLSSLE